MNIETKEKSTKKSVDGVIVKEEKLSDEHIKLAANIKEKLRKTAEMIVEIGTELTNAIKGKSKEYKELFYSEIGMSTRSAQRYMQIAKHEKIKELASKNELEGKTMTDLLQIMSPDNTKRKDTVDTTKVAHGIFSRYKEKPETLTEIIKELEKLLEESKNNQSGDE